MSLPKLKKLVRPPKNPVNTGTPKFWADYEKKIGTALPSDYKQFIDTYGSGDFAQFYSIFNPFESEAVLSQMDEIKQDYREGHDDNEERYPFPVFPEPGGILPWGVDTNGNDYFWLTKGGPDDWTVLAHEVRGDGAIEHPCGMTEFLLKVLKKEIPALASGYPEPENLEFKPLEKANPASEALLDAITERNIARVREAIEAGADLNYRFGEGWSYLDYAAQKYPDGFLEAVQLLVEAGADVNTRNGDGSTPLFSAQPEVVDYLVSHGADVNLRSKNGDTAIFSAIMNSRFELIEQLAKYPGVLEQNNKIGQTPLAFAKRRKNKKAIELLQNAGATA